MARSIQERVGARGKTVYSYKNSTKKLSDAGIDTAIIPVGATEQCGPHLPLHLDTLVADYYARAYGEILHAYVLPTLPFNTSEEHASRPRSMPRSRVPLPYAPRR